MEEIGGVIYFYTDREDAPGNKLMRFDVKSKVREEILLGRDISPQCWDVQGDTIAYSPGLFRFDRPIDVSRISSGEVQLSLAGRFEDVAVSPDESKIAVLKYKREAAGPGKSKRSYYVFGSECELWVMDISTGEEVTKCGKKVLDDGLCWSKDGKCVVFVSFLDNSSFESPGQFPGSTSIHGAAVGGKYEKMLFAFDIESGDVKKICPGIFPTRAVGGEAILFARRDDLYWTKLDDITPRLLLRSSKEHCCVARHAVSKSLGVALLHYPRELFQIAHSPYSFLTLVDISDPDRKCVIDSRSAYNFKWVPTSRRSGSGRLGSGL